MTSRETREDGARRVLDELLARRRRTRGGHGSRTYGLRRGFLRRVAKGAVAALAFAIVGGGATSDLAARDACAVSGTVLDKAGGQGVAGAEVFLIHEARNIASRTVTDSTGAYAFDLVYPPGLYRIVVTRTGYATHELTHLSVSINDTAIPVPPIALDRVTGASQTVTVEGRTAVVNASDAARKTVFDPDRIEALPLSGVRTFDQLALLAPGVFDVPAAGRAGPGVGPGVGTAGQFAVNGARGRSNNFLVDMSDNNDQDVGVRRQGYVSLVPQSIESIENYQIIAGSYQAEFGRNSGSIVNAISRSGGNAVHGTAYEFFADDALAARNVFDRVDGPAAGKSRFRRNQYGFVLGGPLKRDQTFWFGSFERQQITERPELHFAVPTASQRTFFGHSPLEYSAENPIDSTGRSIDDLTRYFRSQGVGLIGLAGRGVWSLVPLPNNSLGPYGANDYTDTPIADGRGTILSFKVDHTFGRNTFTARYNRTEDDAVLPATGGAIRSSVRSQAGTQNLSLFLNGVVGLTGANQARFSYGRTRLDFREADGSPFLFGARDQAELLSNGLGLEPGPVFREILAAPIETDFGSGRYGPFGTTGALGGLLVRPFSPIGVDVYDFPQSRANNTYQFADTISRRAGSHTLRAGFDLRRTQQNSRLDRNLRPMAEFSGAFDSDIDLLDRAVRGTDLASIGYANGFVQVLVPDLDGNGRADFDTTVGLRLTELSLFVQDDWKVQPNLSVGYGVRYELNAAPSEVNRKLEATFADPRSGLPASTAPPALAAYERDFESVAAALGAFVAGRGSIFETSRQNWGPRFGIAWDPTGAGRAAVRAGYGVYFDPTITAVTSQSRNVFPHLVPLNSAGFGAAIRGLFLTNPQYLTLFDLDREIPMIRPGTIATAGTPPGYFRALIGLLTRDYGQGVAFTLPPPRLRSPYGQHFHLTLERELPGGVLATAGYFGSRGVQLTRFRSPNGGVSGTPAFRSARSPIPGGLTELIGETGPPPRVEPRLGAYTVFENSASSTFHSLQLAAGARLADRLQVTAAYVWSHALDDVSDVFDGIGFAARPQSERARSERASASFDTRHRLAASGVWTLPRLGGSRVAGGWMLSGMLFIRSGQPFTVTSAFDVNGDGVLTDRLDTMAGVARVDRGAVRYALPPGAVRDGIARALLARPGEDGRVGRNTFSAPGMGSLDLALFRRFRTGERATVELRCEAFNVVNRTHFGVPVRTIEAPAFGRSVDTLLPARQLQLALKVRF